MSEEQSGKQGFKVADRRRFDEQGNAKEASEKAEERESAENASTSDGRAERSEAGAVEITFSSFVMSLATQALMQLGEIQVPAEVAIPVDRVAAKQTIDVLTMLDEKSKGNLDPQEARLMEEVLHSVRLSYVKKA